jgi:hypothetical protein
LSRVIITDSINRKKREKMDKLKGVFWGYKGL